MNDTINYKIIPKAMSNVNFTTKLELVLIVKGILYTDIFDKKLFIKTAFDYLKSDESGSTHKNDKSRLVTAKWCFSWMRINGHLSEV